MKELDKVNSSEQQKDSNKKGIKHITVSGVHFENEHWDNYKLKSMNQKPKAMLVDFLSSHQGEFKTAIDLGAGSFVDSRYMANQGIRVRAIDSNINVGILKHQYLNSSDPSSVQSNLTVQAQDFAHLKLPKVDFVYSFSSLPFCPEPSFINMITNIASSVNKNGYVALQFFGDKHPFVEQGNARGFNAEQLEKAFSYLGFTNTKTIKWTSSELQSGEKLPNLDNIFLTAQAPEQLAEFSRETLQDILGLTSKQEEAEDKALVSVSKVFEFHSNENKEFFINPVSEQNEERNRDNEQENSSFSYEEKNLQEDVLNNTKEIAEDSYEESSNNFSYEQNSKDILNDYKNYLQAKQEDKLKKSCSINTEQDNLNL